MNRHSVRKWMLLSFGVCISLGAMAATSPIEIQAAADGERIAVVAQVDSKDRPAFVDIYLPFGMKAVELRSARCRLMVEARTKSAMTPSEAEVFINAVIGNRAQADENLRAFFGKLANTSFSSRIGELFRVVWMLDRSNDCPPLQYPN